MKVCTVNLFKTKVTDTQRLVRDRAMFPLILRTFTCFACIFSPVLCISNNLSVNKTYVLHHDNKGSYSDVFFIQSFAPKTNDRHRGGRYFDNSGRTNKVRFETLHEEANDNKPVVAYHREIVYDASGKTGGQVVNNRNIVPKHRKHFYSVFEDDAELPAQGSYQYVNNELSEGMLLDLLGVLFLYDRLQLQIAYFAI